jgi:DNA-binding MarR family transcriptional regulator
MHVSLKKYGAFVRSMAPSGNLFLLLSIQELRRQGLTFLAFYALQRTIGEPEVLERSLRRETGLSDYEMSRACSLLARSGLIEIRKSDKDARARMLTPTELGRRVHDRVLAAAATRFKEGVNDLGVGTRLTNATRLLQEANRALLGPVQLSFFEIADFEEARAKRLKKTRARSKRPTAASK